MSSVKRLDRSASSIQALAGFVFGRVRQVMLEEDWGGIRPSHIRVLEAIPKAGVSVTELAERVGMTKQGAGQFVSELEGSGHVRSAADPADRRTRRITRTATGTRLVRRFERRSAQLEQAWADIVGPERYATFRAVLAELAAAEEERPSRP